MIFFVGGLDARSLKAALLACLMVPSAVNAQVETEACSALAERATELSGKSFRSSVGTNLSGNTACILSSSVQVPAGASRPGEYYDLALSKHKELYPSLYRAVNESSDLNGETIVIVTRASDGAGKSFEINDQYLSAELGFKLENRWAKILLRDKL